MEHSGTVTPVRSGSQAEVFDCPELLGHIFANLKPEKSQPLLFHIPQLPGRPKHRDLLWVALACKSFLDPALDILWGSMNSVIPLLKLLPSFQLVSDAYVSHSSYIHARTNG